MKEDPATHWQDYVARGHKRLFSRIVRNAPLTHVARIVDVGAGSGDLGISILRRYPKASGTLLDVDSVSVKRLAANVRIHELEKRAQIRRADAERYLPRRKTFDLIILSNILHLIDRARRVSFLTKCTKSLTERGSILVVEPLLAAVAGRNDFFDVNVMLRSLGRGGLLYRAELTNLMRSGGCKRTWSFEAGEALDLFGRCYSAFLYRL
jgi:2-polyprenyl-3-methyl-5-hydroxy-6-metoxy-1,4-benzoquinol methylase